MSNFPWWVHWIVCGMLSSGLWCVVMLLGFTAIGFPRKRERELRRLVKELEGFGESSEEESVTPPTKKAGGPIPIEELGWTPEDAAEARARLSAFAPFWDDPSMARKLVEEPSSKYNQAKKSFPTSKA